MTKPRLLYGLMLLLSVVFIVATGSRAAYTALYALVLTAAISGFTVISARFKLRVDMRSANNTVFKGEELIYEISVVNKGIFAYPRIEFIFREDTYADYREDAGLPGIGAKEAITRICNVRFKYRGVYSIGVKYLTVMDYLGLIRLRIRLNGSEEITVFPGFSELYALELKDDLFYKAFNDYDFYQDNYADVADVRKYVPSDEYRKIHWKLTAKKNEFIVRNFQSAHLRKIIFFMDTRGAELKGERKASFEDMVTERAAALIRHCTNRRLIIELIYGVEDILTVRDAADLESAYHLLAGLKFGADIPNPEEYLEGLEGQFNIVFFLLELNRHLYDAIRNMRNSGHNVILFYFGTHNSAGLFLADLTEAGVIIRCEISEA